MLARRAEIVVNYNGKNITKKISDYIQSFDYTDNASGSADTVTLKLSDIEKKWIGSWIPIQGDYVSITIKISDWTKAGDNRKLNCGKFFLDDLSFSGPSPSTASIGGITTPIAVDFNCTEKSKTWKKTTTKGILSEIAKKAKIKLYYSGEVYKISELEQSGQTDMSFAFDLCKKYNLAMKLYNEKLVVFDQTDYEKKKAKCKVDREDMQSFSAVKSMTKLYDGVQISYSDGKKDKTYKYKYKISSGSRILKITEKAESLQDAEIKAKSKLLEFNRKCQTITFKVLGDTKYIASSVVEITGMGKLNGNYYLDTVKHSKAPRSGYTCDITAHKVVIVPGVKVASQPKTATVKKENKNTGRKYTIVSGDTLWGISSRFLGSGSKYMQIYNSNKSTIESAAKRYGKSSSSNGHWIYPGTVLNIPG